MSWLINAAQAEKFRKSQKALIIVDASWHGTDSDRDAKQEFIDKHILGAQFMNLSDFTDPHSDLPNTLLLDEKLISEKLSALGIRNDFKIIFYDNSDLHSACRAVWMMKMFGHASNQLYILDGGLHAWEKFKGKTASGEATPKQKTYTAKIDRQYLRTLTQMKQNLAQPTEQVIDVRHAVRFSGGNKSREGIRKGHIPGSVNCPYPVFFDKNHYFLPLNKIRQKLLGVTLNLSFPVVSTCGSGMTAPITDFLLDILGHTQHAVYDGSWTEWGALKLYPGETDISERPIETCLEEVKEVE